MRVPPHFINIEPAPSLVQQVIQALEAKIQDGSLRPGDTLPAERVLGAQLEVSRTVIRGAVADMAARGLLEALPGGGYLVRIPTAENLSHSISYMLRGSQKGLTYPHIHQVRCVLEIEIAGLAAQNRTLGDLAAMQQWLAVMTTEAAPTEAYCAADVAFHRSLAVATQNPLFVVLLDAIAEILIEVRRSGMALLSSIERGMGFHHQILAAIQAGDSLRARAAMEAHLADSEEIQKHVAGLLI
ncbi:FadR/GntR family transcriptional regulator [Armatimonas sp.]|uniref:FadR/GntR family transcriptional regulator n=1 Tax=Armatimonas sp. TaxID=1872638 RepID=UPI00286B2372|nr:FadR/GntR family transcriptional regulator [Armatimonas sp.]